MNCSNCGNPIPPGATACYRCGTPTTPYYSNIAAPQNIPYQGAPSPQTPPPPSPTPHASRQPYTLYDPYNPYGPLQPTPPSSPPRRGNRIALIIGLGLLVLLLIVGGLFAFLSHPNSTRTGTTTNLVTPQPSPTASSTRNPYSPYTGTLILNDPMHDNSRGYKWDEATINGAGTCGYSAGTYHIKALQKGVICNPEAPALLLTNFVFEVKLTIIKGEQAGIVFRVNQTQGSDYICSIDTQGNYYIYSEINGVYGKSLSSGSNAAILKGQNQTNLLAVVAIGSTFSLYVNGQYVDQGKDSTLPKGQIGLIGTSNTGSTDVAAGAARVWKL